MVMRKYVYQITSIGTLLDGTASDHSLETGLVLEGHGGLRNVIWSETDDLEYTTALMHKVGDLSVSQNITELLVHDLSSRADYYIHIVRVA